MLFSSCYVAALLSSFTINHPLCGVSGGKWSWLWCNPSLWHTRSWETEMSPRHVVLVLLMLSIFFHKFWLFTFLLHIHRPLQFFSALFKLHSPTFNHPITPPLYIYLSLLSSPPQHLSCMANSNSNTFSYWIMLSSFFYLVSAERKHKSSSSSYIYLCVSLTHELGFISIWLPHE